MTDTTTPAVPGAMAMTDGTTHELKTVQPHFDDVEQGRKPFEVRLDDRGYQVGDYLMLREWSDANGYSGRQILRRVEHILRDFPGLTPGWIVMAIERDGIAEVRIERSRLRAQVRAGKRVRAEALEEAAKICERIRDNEFGKLPGHEHEPDFSTDDACAEDVCAWHIRYVASTPQPAPTEGGKG